MTGGLASGKTSVCCIFEQLGAYVVSADKIVHQLLSLKTPVGQQVARLFGPEILSDGQIDRKKIAEKVFSDIRKLKTLEKLIHPAVLDEIEKRYQKIKQDPVYSLFVAEIPLLYEIESQGLFDTIIAVTADPLVSRARFVQTTGYPPEEYDRRMTFQLSLQEKAARADFTIVNDGDLTQLKNQVLSILKEPRCR